MEVKDLRRFAVCMVESGYSIGVRRVEPHSKEEFHLTDTRTIKFEELPKPEVAEPAGDTVAA